MRVSATSDREPTPARRINKVAIIAAKLLVTGACFWYLSWQIDLGQVFSSIPLLELRWAALATLMVMLQIPLVAMRWREILHVLAAIDRRMTNASIIAITAIGVFFTQVLPSVMGDGIRAWLLVRLGCEWRSAVTSVVIDRGVGAGLLIALGFVILLLPSGLSALGGYRVLVLIVYGALLFAGAIVLLLLPRLIALLDRVPYLRWMAGFGGEYPPCRSWPQELRDFGPCLSHPRTHHPHNLVARTGAGIGAADPRRGRAVCGDGRRGIGAGLDQRMGAARGRRCRNTRPSRRGAGAGPRFFSGLRSRSGGRIIAWSAGVAFVFTCAGQGLCRVQSMNATALRRYLPCWAVPALPINDPVTPITQ
jgi:hypothetical protein